ncbi:hypothetical protein J437_LFUL007523 [Ladona fulva]|uniref:FAS1 domain-containing protein n=1 Tax=Ladona fulva TaxID=123851 RepID=A0A8K0K445_LADFU|nr:hypothetical protein J437_LFUL007523 [Ladona fulva]
MVENHVLAHPICPSTVIGEQKLRTLSAKGGKLTLECNTPRKGGGHSHRGEIVMRVIEGQKLPKEYTLSKNGPLFMVGKVVLPDRAKTLMQLMEHEDLREFLKIIQYAGLEDNFEKFGDFTVFGPTNEAMKTIPKSMMEELKSNKEKAKKFVLYHGTQGRLKTDQIAHQQVVMSLDEENPLRLQVLRKAIGVENALISKGNKEGLNGVLHVITKPLFPSNRSAGDLLRNNGNFSIFLEAVGRVMETVPNALELTPITSTPRPTTTHPPPPPPHLPTYPSHNLANLHRNYTVHSFHPTASYFSNSTYTQTGTSSWWSSWYSYSSSSSSSSMSASSSHSSSGASKASFSSSSSSSSSASFLHSSSSSDSPESMQPSSLTLFVPTDEAFHKLGKERLRKVMEDIPYLTKTIKNHVSQNMMCTESFRPGLHYDVRTGHDALDIIRKGKKIKVNDATIVNSDLLNSNGVIHVIDRVLLP